MTNERLPWFPCYPAKLLGAFAAMKPDEGYVYWIVCLRIYEIGGPCRDTLEAISRRTGLNKRRVSDSLDRLFKSGKLVREGNGIMNPFAAVVLADSIALHQERVRAGREGAARRAEKHKQNQRTPLSRAEAGHEQSPTHLHLHLQEQIESKEVRKEESLALTGGGLSRPKREPIPDGWPRDAWIRFYDRFPNKVGKQAALKAFGKIARSGTVTFDGLMEGLGRYVDKTDDRPWCNPATWLNQHRWDDQPATANGQRGGRSFAEIAAGR